jgi:hypothetical protein
LRGHRARLIKGWKQQDIWEGVVQPFIKTVTADGRRKVGREAAKDHAWREAERVYPVAAVPELSVNPGQLPPAESLAERPEPLFEATTRYVGSIPIPNDWPDLPDSAPYREEVKWLSENLEAIKDGRAHTIRLVRAFRPAPCKATIGKAVHFNKYPREFYEKVEPRVLGSVGDNVTDRERDERSKIEDIKALLERLRDAKE